MRKFGVLFIVLVVLFAGGWSSCDRGEDGGDVVVKGELTKAGLLNAESAFSLAFFSKLQNSYQDTNICFSPYSLYEALAMAANGSAGSNLLEFLDVLELDRDYIESLNSLIKSMRTELLGADPETVFTIANSFWYNQNWSVYPEFTKKLENHFQARVSSLDFSLPASVDTINQWVSDNTNGRIRDLVSGLSQTDACHLINALYFKGNWSQVFDRNQTLRRGFRTPDGSIACNLMLNYGPYEVFADEKNVGVKLPYGNGHFAMYAFMPRDYRKSLRDYFVEDLSQTWPDCIHGFVIDTTSIKFPQFRIENDFLLNDFLIQCGLREAFEGGADFSKLGPGQLKISKVRQKTFINVNEEGTEGAAATSISLVGDGLLLYNFDRPFIYIIADTESGTPIFMGQVTHPTPAL